MTNKEFAISILIYVGIMMAMIIPIGLTQDYQKNKSIEKKIENNDTIKKSSIKSIKKQKARKRAIQIQGSRNGQAITEYRFPS